MTTRSAAAAGVLDLATQRHRRAALRHRRNPPHLGSCAGAPDFAEAWHKRATLYYPRVATGECLEDIGRTLELEPRHFAAMMHFGETPGLDGWRRSRRASPNLRRADNPSPPSARAGGLG